MKALVLAGGRGSRLKEITLDLNKCMCLYRGRHIIENSLDAALRVGAEEIVIVVGYRAETIINVYGNCYQGVRIRYVIQWEQKGVVHAIECARGAIDGHDFFLTLADEVLVDPRHEVMREAFQNERIFALCGVVRVQDLNQIKKTYALMVDGAGGQIYRLVEKPRTPLGNLQGTGNCLFRNAIFDYIPDTPINQQRQEKELPDLIQCAVDSGKTVKIFDIGSMYANVNTSDELNNEMILPDTSPA